MWVLLGVYRSLLMGSSVPQQAVCVLPDAFIAAYNPPNVVVGGFSRENPHKAPHVGMGAPTISGGKHRKKGREGRYFFCRPPLLLQEKATPAVTKYPQ